MDFPNLTPAQATFVNGLAADPKLLDRVIYFARYYAERHSYDDCIAEGDCDDCYWAHDLFKDVWSKIGTAKDASSAEDEE